MFDFLKRKRPVTESNDEEPSPHYIFAHYALRHIALSDPLSFLAIAASPEAVDFVEKVISDVSERCGKPAGFGGKDVKFHPTRVCDYPCAMIELPTPNQPAEAHMVALVALIDLSQPAPPKRDQIQSRYFTLEKGITLTNEPRTVLAEWSTTVHSNYGSGPNPTFENFAAAIESILQP